MKKIILLIVSVILAVPLFADTVIQMEPYGGVYRVPCLVNGAKMKFIFDTGASNVCLSLPMAEYLYDNGYITDKDILGTGSATVADGRIVDHIRINLKEIQIGDKVLTNVETVVVNGQSAPLLLGQSALKKLGQYSISGDKLIFKSFNSPSEDDEDEYEELTDDEINKLFKDAIVSFNEGLYSSALESYEILYDNGLLSPLGILNYADCNYFTDDKEFALELYCFIQNEIESNHPNQITWLYYQIGRCYWVLKQYDAAIPYLEKMKLNSKKWSDDQKSAVDLLADVYLKKGNVYKAERTLSEYCDQYLKFMEISATDCWDKCYVDKFLSELYFRMYLVVGDRSIQDAEKYLILSAAWGEKEAIETCNKFNINYVNKPRNYVY